MKMLNIIRQLQKHSIPPLLLSTSTHLLLRRALYSWARRVIVPLLSKRPLPFNQQYYFRALFSWWFTITKLCYQPAASGQSPPSNSPIKIYPATYKSAFKSITTVYHQMSPLNYILPLPVSLSSWTSFHQYIIVMAGRRRNNYYWNMDQKDLHIHPSMDIYHKIISE